MALLCAVRRARRQHWRQHVGPASTSRAMGGAAAGAVGGAAAGAVGGTAWGADAGAVRDDAPRGLERDAPRLAGEIEFEVTIHAPTT